VVRRAQEYEQKINSGDLIAIAEVVRDLHRADDQREQSYSSASSTRPPASADPRESPASMGVTRAPPPRRSTRPGRSAPP
jgi:CarD family transcriptional regulator